MVDRWIVFGGWAISPEILLPVFGDKSAYIDANTIIPNLIYNGTFYSDWDQKLFSAIEPSLPDKPFGIAGWSTGTLLAASLSSRLNPVAGAFLSATPSFCRRRESGFVSGQKSSVLKAMREQLAVDPDKVVNNFVKQCGLSEKLDVIPTTYSRPPAPPQGGDSGFELTNEFPLRGPGGVKKQSTVRQTPRSFNQLNKASFPKKHTCEQLIYGLHFLEQATLLPVQRFNFPTLFLHGKEDTIVPISAGRYFSDAAGGTFMEFDGPHAFFLKDPSLIANHIENFIKKVS